MLLTKQYDEDTEKEKGKEIVEDENQASEDGSDSGGSMTSNER